MVPNEYIDIARIGPCTKQIFQTYNSFSYDYVDYHVSPDGRIWFNDHGTWHSRANGHIEIPSQMYEAVQLWSKSSFQALPLHEFLSMTLREP